MPHRSIDTWVLNPLNRLTQKSTSSGILLFFMAFISLIIANSSWHEVFEAFWTTKISLSFGDFELENTLRHWVDDGLMSLFFFVIGLELKRELVAGELVRPKDSLMPIVAAIGGMILPAIIFYIFNKDASIEALSGWGIPMATDIAFALGVIFLLGDKVPIALKVFLTAFAIIDDVGAISVIAFFYTDSLSFLSLLFGVLFLCVMLMSNRLGIRNSLFYGIIGIGGVWLFFLLSGVHATIAAVLAAFTIPTTLEVRKQVFVKKMSMLSNNLNNNDAEPYHGILDHDEEVVYNKINIITKKAVSPLQRLEHKLHPVVAFIVMPIFALANAGVRIEDNILDVLSGSVAMGVVFGLIIGKVVGIVGFVYLFSKLKLFTIPETLTFKMILGVSFLGAIGFTMSLFITSLAFETSALVTQAKLGVLTASLIAGTIGFFFLKWALKDK